MPMIGELTDLTVLKTEFSHDEVFSRKVFYSFRNNLKEISKAIKISHTDLLFQVENLMTEYCNMRKTRPDGNCFLRGFIFAYLEYCIQNKKELTR